MTKTIGEAKEPAYRLSRPIKPEYKSTGISFRAKTVSFHFPIDIFRANRI